MAQVGTDRIVELQFSDGQYRLFLEFYAGGNIILTDQDLSIKALFRIVPEGPGQEELRVGAKYSLDNRQNYNGTPPLTDERVKAGLQEALRKASSDTLGTFKKTSRKPGHALRKALVGSFSEFPPTLLDHALRVADFDASTEIEDILGSDDTTRRLLRALEEAQRIDESITVSKICKGYIIAKPQHNAISQHHDKRTEIPSNNRQEGLIYDNFQPFRPRQFEEDRSFKILEFDGFNRTVDEFFSSIESQKLESRLTEREEHARRKLETAKQDHEKRLGGLQQVQELNMRKAQALEGNLQRAQEAISAVNSLVAQSIGWPEIARLIEMEQQRNNPVAEMIKLPLKLHENTVTLMLMEADFEDEADFEGNETGSDVSDSEDEGEKFSKARRPNEYVDKRLAVDVDLEISPWSNARQYYDQKKTAAVKEQRTMQSSEKALKSTERKINADLRKGLKQEKEVLRPQRKASWFEKYFHFISSEGYLVLGGKDLLQCEIIYQKHLKKGDAYVHADLQGAASTIVKNKPGKSDEPIPPSTLSQAGTLAVCTSSAWDSKAIMSAWWVHADQVSKTAQTGEYLQAGIFSIRGQKIFLPPAQLLLGFGLMFKISKESKARHLKHRFQVNEGTHSMSAIGSNDTLNVKDETVVDEYDQSQNPEEGNQVMKPQSEKHEHKDVFTASTSDSDDSEEGSQNEDRLESRFYNPLQPRGTQDDVSNRALSDIVNAGPSDSSCEDENEQVTDVVVEKRGIAHVVSEAEISSTANRDAGNGIRHLSARERRLMRKGKQPRASEDNRELSVPATSTQDHRVSSQASYKHANSPAQVRGKKGQRNKIKTKYADQDEEDRALAMRLLGSAAAQEKAREDIEAKTSKEEELDAAKERRRKQHIFAVEKGKEAEERRRLLFEGLEALEEDEPETAEDLEALVGVPLPGDEIIDTLVVCGPWDAIGSRCKWRVKLQPGSLKKGKAVKEILGAWNAALTAWDKKKRTGSGDGNEIMVEEDEIRKREAELIRAIREPEVIGVVPVGKVRIITGSVDGFSKAKGGGAVGKGKRGNKGSKRR